MCPPRPAFRLRMLSQSRVRSQMGTPRPKAGTRSPTPPPHFLGHGYGPTGFGAARNGPDRRLTTPDRASFAVLRPRCVRAASDRSPSRPFTLHKSRAGTYLTRRQGPDTVYVLSDARSRKRSPGAAGNRTPPAGADGRGRLRHRGPRSRHRCQASKPGGGGTLSERLADLDSSGFGDRLRRCRRPRGSDHPSVPVRRLAARQSSGVRGEPS